MFFYIMEESFELTEEVAMERITARDVIPILHAAFARYETDPIPSSALQETVESVQASEANGALWLGWKQMNQVIAVVRYDQHATEATFSRLAVHPDYQQQGIASQCLVWLEQFARSQDVVLMQAKVRASEPDNLAFYQRRGYVIVSHEITINGNGHAVKTISIAKQL